MTQYVIYVNENTTYKLVIEADSEKQALRKLNKTGYNHTNIDETELVNIDIWEAN